MPPHEGEELREIDLQALLLDAVDAATIATDLDAVVTHWSKGAQRLYGWSREEAVGRSVMELTVHERDRARARFTLAGMLPTGHWEGEFEVCRRDGSTFPAYVRNAVFCGLDGERAGIVWVSVDISRRVETDWRLRAAARGSWANAARSSSVSSCTRSSAPTRASCAATTAASCRSR